MKMVSKKSILMLAASAIILAGAASPFVVQAAAEADGVGRPPGIHQRQLDPDQAAQRIADAYGADKGEILKYHDNGVHFKDIFKASFIAKASGKPLQEVMQAKTPDNTWKDVAKSLGVTRENMKAARNDLAASRLENKLHIAKATSLELMSQGYHPRDIAVANALATNSGKSVNDVLAMRKINNTWHDVAGSLGVDDKTFKQDMQDLQGAFPHRGGHDQEGQHR